jgi:endonuclease/exonuclease/phosphatase family metal-dependent hydrolase
VELTLASYNIHSGIGTDGKFDLERVSAVLEEIRPDVVALQEVGDFRGVTPREDHPEFLAGRLGMQLAFGPNVERNGRRYGNAVLSRLPILRYKNYDLSVPSREPRGALRADLDLGGERLLHVFSVHLGLSPRERRAQEELLLTADILREATRPDPVVVCGDFNYLGNRPVPALVRRALADVAHQLGVHPRTFHARFPFIRLDRIYVDSDVQSLALETHRSERSRAASDHLPLVLRLRAPVRGAFGASTAVQVGS